MDILPVYQFASLLVYWSVIWLSQLDRTVPPSVPRLIGQEERTDQDDIKSLLQPGDTGSSGVLESKNHHWNYTAAS